MLEYSKFYGCSQKKTKWWQMDVVTIVVVAQCNECNSYTVTLRLRFLHTNNT